MFKIAYYIETKYTKLKFVSVPENFTRIDRWKEKMEHVEKKENAKSYMIGA